jgi:hypothetical protein
MAGGLKMACLTQICNGKAHESFLLKCEFYWPWKIDSEEKIQRAAHKLTPLELAVDKNIFMHALFQARTEKNLILKTNNSAFRQHKQRKNVRGYDMLNIHI